MVAVVVVWLVVVADGESGVWTAQVGTVIAIVVFRRKHRRRRRGHDRRDAGKRDYRGRRCVVVVIVSRGVAVTRQS